MKSNIELVTPHTAKEMLERNFDGNRKIRKDHVIFLAGEISAGRWIESAMDPIRFDTEGNLIDGQHRLSAVVKSNKSVRFMIYRNVDSESFKVIDIGMKRGANDLFTFRGYKNPANFSSGIKLYLNLRENRVSFSQSAKRTRISHQMILSEYEKNMDFWNDVMDKTNKWYREFNHVLKPAFIMGFYVHLRKQSHYGDKADLFFDDLCINTSPGDLISSLRDKLIRDLSTRGMRMTSMFKVGLIIKYWNAYVTSPKTKQISYSPEKEGKLTIL